MSKQGSDVTDIKKEEFIKRFKSTFVYDLLSQTLTDEQLFEHVIDPVEGIIWFKDQTRQMWFMWQQAQKVAVPDGFVLVEKKILLEGVNKIEQLFEEDSLLALGELLPIQQGLKAMVEAQENSK